MATYRAKVRSPLSLVKGYADQREAEELTPSQGIVAPRALLEKRRELGAIISEFVDERERADADHVLEVTRQARQRTAALAVEYRRLLEKIQIRQDAVRIPVGRGRSEDQASTPQIRTPALDRN